MTVVTVAHVRPEGVAKLQAYEQRARASEAFAGYRDDPRRKAQGHLLADSGATQVLEPVDLTSRLA